MEPFTKKNEIGAELLPCLTNESACVMAWSYARILLPVSLASVPFGFELVRVWFRYSLLVVVEPSTRKIFIINFKAFRSFRAAMEYFFFEVGSELLPCITIKSASPRGLTVECVDSTMDPSVFPGSYSPLVIHGPGRFNGICSALFWGPGGENWHSNQPALSSIFVSEII